MTKPLSEYFTINRRFARSINLERDFDSTDALQGYILTDRSVAALEYILIDSENSDITRATTITSVYGTGKSAFANFLCSLCATEGSPVREMALNIAQKSLDDSELQKLLANLSKQGFLRAIATAQREPLAHTIIRALAFGVSKSSNATGKRIEGFATQIANGETVANLDVLTLLKEVLKTAKKPVILIIDELGKSLEFAVLRHRNDDLYLLQQIAELKLNKSQAFYFVGMLHQSFADYGHSLATVQRNEWSKIQGRFKDFAFSDLPRQMTKLMGQAIVSSLPTNDSKKINTWAKNWCKQLTRYGVKDISTDLLASTYPLHPIAALVLPILCNSYAQNDRSLFTFLASPEAYSFQNYLQETEFNKDFPLLKLDRIYDYFVEAIGTGFGSRPQLNKWVEIHTLISSMEQKISTSELNLLKTIGILNLVDSVGEFKATPQLVRLALIDTTIDVSRDGEAEIKLLLNDFPYKGFINHRKDELRLWEGTDFNIEAELISAIASERDSLAEILSSSFSLKPAIAQRHSYQTGTVRYFEFKYLDSCTNWDKLQCSNPSYDGMIAYWLDSVAPTNYPKLTIEGKPLVLITTTNLGVLKAVAVEYKALQKLQSRSELLHDRVARGEVNFRFHQAELRLGSTFRETFNLLQCECWVLGEKVEIARNQDFNAQLSKACDLVYKKSPVLKNELINRRELTGQAVKAMRTLIEAMLNHPEQERLGLAGYGPETSIYESVLNQTGIHRQENEVLGFYPPKEQSIKLFWLAIESFCLSAVQKSLTLNNLYQQLEAPPYGVKRGLIPILLASVLLYHNDDVSIYKDGVFIPVLGSEHFELLVKHPQRFAVRYFEIIGVRSQVFRELEAILTSPNPKKVNTKIRNVTMLSVVKPLFQFAKNLPAYTAKTKRITSEAQEVVKALGNAQEPDELIFNSLPVACGMEPIISGESEDGAVIAKEFKSKLVKVLHEIQTAYDSLLAYCYDLLYAAFGVTSSKEVLREDLRVRASYLTDACLERTLRRFTLAAAEKNSEDKTWLESLLMIVSDKPAESWSDNDVVAFESKLGDLARRFINLEALQKGMAASKNKGFDARRITIARPDGYEVHRLLWISPEDKEQIALDVAEILKKPMYQNNKRLQEGLVAIFAETALDIQASEDIIPISAKTTSQKHSQRSSKIN
ncbi:ATP-binding protein [Tumidithrix helvetica PCC 7403]|uniref:hypothetical protein n=1 Tax=Tumidithrix helvetica TaxID=3457545 RepID=UPI003CB02929